MAFIAFLLLTGCHFMSGYGILTLFRLRLPAVFTITLSLLLGIAVASFIPFLLQLFYIILTGTSVFLSLTITALLLNIPTFLRIRREGFRAAGMASGMASGRKSTSYVPGSSNVPVPSNVPGSFRIRPYEIPYLLIIGFILFVSVWRCYYLPPTSRDALSGPEAIAEYAVREHTLVNSFFSVDLWSTNNPFKSPYLVSLQMIYKMAGFPFGQVWLSTVVISFTLFLYHALRQRVHPVIAGLLLLIFTMIPEVYSYTFMILYDYSNMVFFFLSLYFLFDYFNSSGGDSTNGDVSAGHGRRPYFYLAGLLMGIATYIRSETLVLAILFLPILLFTQFRGKYPVKKMLRDNAFFIVPSLVGYYLPTQFYIKYYLPVHYNIGSQVNDHLSDLQPLFQRYKEIITRLMTSGLGIHLWGYIIYIFFFLFLAESIFLRRFSKEARNWLYAITVFYLGLGLLGWLLPLMSLLEGTKRALFKIFPLLVLYMAGNGWLTRLSSLIYRWETAPAPARAPAKVPAKTPAASSKKKPR
jgi:hypothetical protein